MKMRMFARMLACLLVSVLTFLTMSISPTSVEHNVVASGEVTLQPVADQVARIIVASQTGGVNWGNEPLVLTMRPSPTDATLSAVISPASLLTGSFSGLNGNVLTLTPTGTVGDATVTVTATKNSVSATTTFKVQINKYEDTGQYKWDSMQIPGGGFVDGYVFHPSVPNILYARTDVGGAWRYNFTTQKWESISNWVRDDISGSPAQQLGLAIDPDPSRASYVYLAYGSSGTIVRSTDYGQSWVRLGNTGGSAAGNVDGRGSGERLIVMPGTGQTMYFAGTTGGLRKSTDGGNTWTGINLIHNVGRNPTTNEAKLTLVNYDPSNPNFIIVGTSGTNGNPVNSVMTRGASMFYSTDGGATFAELPDQPLPGAMVTTGSRYYGYMGYRSTFSAPDGSGNRYMFITYSDTGSASIGMEGQGVDGALIRYKVNSAGAIIDYTNVTPVRVTNTYIKNADGLQANRQFGVGIGGVSLDPQHPGTMIVSSHNSDFNSPDPTLESRNMDGIFRSLDYGETWFPVLTGYDMYGNINPIGDKAPYARPLASGATDNKDGQTPRWEPWTNLHWDTSPTINPFDSNMAFYNTGAGAYMTHNLTALDGINAAEPHAVPAPGLTPLQGLFISESNVITGEVDSRYTPYLIGNSINHLTSAQSVAWEATVGLEMTVHLGAGLYSPPSGDVILLDMLGDHGGFAFTSTTTLPQNSFAYPRQIPPEFQSLTGGSDYYPTDTWITGRNASYAAMNPDIVVATVSGSWHYNNYGGAIITFDNAKTWFALPDGWTGGASRPEYAMYGIGNGMPTPALQTLVNNQKASANSVSGHVVVNADASTVMWAITNLNLTSQVYTTDFGQNWHQVLYYNTANNLVTSGTTYLVPDNVNPQIVYAFGTTTYVSQDGGHTFHQATTTYGSFSTSGLATINGSREIRPDLNNEGIIFIGGSGLWKLTYNKVTNAMSAVQVPSINTVSRYGPGIGVNANPNNKALYIYGNKTGTGQQSGFGIWRSLDGGTTWLKISQSTNNPSPAGTAADPYLNTNVQFADVRSVVGDSRTFGRVYLDTGNTAGGVTYGDIVTNLIETPDAHAHFTPSTPISVSVGTTFTIDLLVNSGSQAALAQQSYLTFPSNMLQNVQRGTPGTLTDMVEPDTTKFESVLQNQVCNGPGSCTWGAITAPAGSLAYASGTLSTTLPSGDFRVARVTFKATTAGDATVHWQFSPPAPADRNSSITDANNNVVSDQSLYQDFVIHVVSPTVTGHVVWEGSPTQPNVLQSLPISLTLSGPNLYTFPGLMTDANGNFSVTPASIAPGTYTWRVKGPQYLSTTGTVTIGSDPNIFIEMGLQPVGDANNDNLIDILDFGILSTAFGHASPDPLYDARADFNGDQIVDILDFALLHGNFGRLGNRPAQAPPAVQAQTGSATLELRPQGKAPANGGTVNVGDSFTLELWVNAQPGTSVIGQQSYLSFPAGMLQLGTLGQANPVPNSAGKVTQDKSVLDLALQNAICNGAAACTFNGLKVDPGTLSFASGTLGQAGGTGSFRIGTVTVQATQAGIARLHWQFGAPGTRNTTVVGNSGAVTNAQGFVDYVVNVLSTSATPRK